VGLRITLITVVAVLVGASGLLLGCGGDDDNSDEEAITEVWDQFAAAVGQKDGERACSYLSEQGQKFVRGQPVEMTECAENLSGPVAKGSTFGRIPSVTVSEVTVTGDTATVTFEQPQGGPTPEAASRCASPSCFPRFAMIRDGDEWLIDGIVRR
jgi:hypothetical protein